MLFLPLCTLFLIATAQWSSLEIQDPIRFTVALKPKSNRDSLNSVLLSVSDPHSKQYGQHLNSLEIRNLVHNPLAVNSVSDYLNQFNPISLDVAPHGDSISVLMNKDSIEKAFGFLIQSEQHSFTQEVRHQSIGFAKNLPRDINRHIDVILGLSHLPTSSRQRMSPPTGINGPPSDAPIPMCGQGGDGRLYILVLPVCKNGATTTNVQDPCKEAGLSITDYHLTYTVGNKNTTVVIPVNKTYCQPSPYFPGMFCNMWFDGLPANSIVDIFVQSKYQDSSFSSISYFQQVANTMFTDPHILYEIYKIPANMVANKSATQGMVQFQNASFSDKDLETFIKMFKLPHPSRVVVHGLNRPHFVNFEPQLDIQMLSGVGRGAETWAWITSYNGDFAQWATDVNAAKTHPDVFSISYGAPANGYSAEYRERLDHELLKLGLAGVSVLVSTGDDGTQSSVNPETCERLTTSVLASSPYVTAVGGTTLTQTREIVAVQSDKAMYYTAAGGFSWYRSRPDWQKKAVEEYLLKSRLPSTFAFNYNGRAIPDVSAVALNEKTISEGQICPSGGTSTASPIFAGIVTLLNSKRMSLNKSPLGFLNPLLYANPEAFQDITQGDMTCSEWNFCCSTGYYTARHWDPVTGLGVADYPKLERIVSALP